MHPNFYRAPNSSTSEEDVFLRFCKAFYMDGSVEGLGIHSGIRLWADPSGLSPRLTSQEHRKMQAQIDEMVQQA